MTVLDASECKLKVWPKRIRNLSKLQTLDLRRSDIWQPADAFQGLTALKTLHKRATAWRTTSILSFRS